jgi:UTP--glucose-1-phosphate uridylyltransferase
VKQKQQLGTAHALQVAEKWIDSNYFLMSRWDHVFDMRMFEEVMEAHKLSNKPVIGLSEVPRERVHKYGVVQIEDWKIVDMIEKPKREEAPSNYMLNGIYIFPKEIFWHISQIGIDERLGEMLLPDAVKLMLQDFEVVPCVCQYDFLDVGTPTSWYEANKLYFENDGNLFGIILQSSHNSSYLGALLKVLFILYKSTAEIK